jgi:glycosyltransferase involved in cell wall biosynthesis
MVIVFLTSNFKNVVNGPAKFANLLLELNERPGLEIYVLTEDVPEPGSVEANNPHVIPIEVKPNFLNNHFGMITRNTIYARAVKSFIARHAKPDLLLINNAVYGLGLQRALDLPVLGMINDDNSLRVSLAEHGFGYQFIRFSIFKWFELRAIKDLRAIVVNSDYLLSVIRGYQPQAGKLLKLYKSVDTNVAGLNEVSNYGGEIKVLFVKTDFVRGGLFDLLEALGRLDRTFSLTVIGPELKDVTCNTEYHGTPDNVALNVLGRCSQEKVFAELITHHLFCTPSRMEALGVANMEALIHKTPVVFTKVGGVPEVMNFEENGFGAEARNPALLAAAVEACFSQPEIRARKTANGQIFIQDNFSKKAMFDRLEQIFLEIINEQVH